MRLGVAEIPAATLHLFTHTKNNIAMFYDALRKHDLGIFLEFSLKEKFVQSQLYSNASDLQSRSLEAQAEINSSFEIFI